MYTVQSNIRKEEGTITDDGDHVSKHVTLGEAVHGGEVDEAGRLDVALVRLAAPIRHDVDGHFSLRK